MNTMPLESETRVQIDERLKNLGWILTGKKKNVYFEQPKTEVERKLLGGKRPDYVLYSKDERGEDKAIMVIEAKRKGERVDKALEQCTHYAKLLDAPVAFATDGLFCKAYHTKFDRTPILNGEEVDEFLRETIAIRFLANWEVNTVSPKVQYDRRELIKVFDEANNMLRGDGLRAGIERFGEFANILFLKLISENSQILYESGKNPNLDSACRWDSIKNIPSGARIDYINNTVFTRLNDLYKTIIFTQLTMRSDDILKEIMDKLDPLTLTDVDSDVKGDAFEYFLRESAATKNDLGEYFTPRHIVKTMVKLVNPQIGERVYDPFCGTGGFLIESFRHIWNTMARNDKNKETLRKDTVFGNEITNTARITKLNMILAGDGHSNVHMRDSLANPTCGVKGEGYDVVITNMPYSQKSKYGHLYDMPSNNGDSICVQHCMKAINSTAENGRMALVVPEGFLFRKDLSKTRELLLRNCDLQSIISLPQGVFLPYTGVKTNILYATRVNQNIKPSQKRGDFWYFDVKSDGYSLDNHRRKLENGNDLDKFHEYRKLGDDQRQEMLDAGFEIVPLDKVRENSHILVGRRYREVQSAFHEYDAKKMSDISEFIRGITFPKSAQLSSQTSESIGVVTTKAAQVDGIADEAVIFIDKAHEKKDKRLQEGDILISLANSLNLVGRTTYVNKYHAGLSFGAFMGVLRADKRKLLPQFLFYLLNSEAARQFFTTNAKTTTNISNITFEDLGELVLPIPSLEVQRQIVDELDGFQRIIDGARAVIDNYAPKIKINPKWGIGKISDLFDAAGETIDPQSYSGTVNYIGLENISSENGNLVGSIEADTQSIKSAKRSFKEGDILFGRLRPALNKVCVAPFVGICSTDIIVLRPKNKDVMSEFYAVIMRSKQFNETVMHGVSGGQLPRVGADYLLNMPVYIVPISTQKVICEQLSVERTIVEPSKQVVEIFTKKMQDRINEIWGEADWQ